MPLRPVARPRTTIVPGPGRGPLPRPLLALAPVALALIACGPTVVLPGGRLQGEVRPAPSSWAFTESVEIVQIETRPEDPYSVNVWIVELEGALHVAAGAGLGARWARHIAQDPRVRLKIGEAVYAFRAIRVDDPAMWAAFLEAAVRKYAFDPDEQTPDDPILYRLEPRLEPRL